HRQANAAATVLTAAVSNPQGYGRIVRNGRSIARIVEENDASPAERQICEINSGIYVFELAGLFDAVQAIAANNSQREYYLPDVVRIDRSRGLVVEAIPTDRAVEVQGVNSQAELAEASAFVRQETNNALMATGVTLLDPATAYIDDDVQIGADTVIHP